MTEARRPALIIVMGTSGCGKSTVGLALAEALAIPFVDGDDLHPAKNVAKMSAGHPLTDEDRIPWLHRIREDAILLTSRPGLDLLDAHPDAPPSNPARDDDPSSVPPELTLALSRIQPASLRARAIANERGERGRGRPRREGVVVACSALKREYRELLRGEPTRVSTGAAESPSSASSEPSSVVREGKHLDQEIETFFVYLQGTRTLLLNRMEQRPGHFMKASMLDSQLATLQEPDEASEPRVVVVALGQGEGDASRERGKEVVVDEVVTKIRHLL